MSNPITLVFTYYKNPRMLEYQISHWQEYPEGVEIVLVDDGSPLGMRAEEIIARFPPLVCGLKVVRILVDLPWNEPAARNLGVKYTSNKWVFLGDIDHIIPLDTLQKVMALTLDKKTIYSFTRINHFSRAVTLPHKESRLMTSELYWQIGGMDESYCGVYAYYSREWKTRLAGHPTAELPIDLERVDCRNIPDASTVGLIRKEGRDTAFWEEVREWKAENNRPIELFRLPWKLVINRP